ncbi:MAG: STAS/SEC14 domain-containing protein [Actinobacteria bacterium]|nr:MAG: STAS/SEC14 domain-containing protein [Actinomycetota bacterium]
MPVVVIDASGKLLQVKVRGTLQRAEYEKMLQLARETIAREGTMRVLALLDGFEGWERHRDWGDVSFAQEGRHIEKMAIVGDEKWRDEALAFTAAGFRPTAIEFFAASKLGNAKRWLST